MGIADITGLLTVMKRYKREHQMYDVAIDAVPVMSIASAKKPIFLQRTSFSVWIIPTNWYIVRKPYPYKN
jgi:hypothetical protein